MTINMPLYHIACLSALPQDFEPLSPTFPLSSKTAEPMAVPDLLNLGIHLLFPFFIVPMIRVQSRLYRNAQFREIGRQAIEFGSEFGKGLGCRLWMSCR